MPGKSAFYGRLGVSGGENPPQGVSGWHFPRSKTIPSASKQKRKALACQAFFPDLVVTVNPKNDDLVGDQISQMLSPSVWISQTLFGDPPFSEEKAPNEHLGKSSTVTSSWKPRAHFFSDRSLLPLHHWCLKRDILKNVSQNQIYNAGDRENEIQLTKKNSFHHVSPALDLVPSILWCNRHVNLGGWFFQGPWTTLPRRNDHDMAGSSGKKVDPINSLLHHHFLAVKNLTVQSAGAAAILHTAGSQPAGRALGFTSHHIAYVTYILYIIIHVYTYNV